MSFTLWNVKAVLSTDSEDKRYLSLQNKPAIFIATNIVKENAYCVAIRVKISLIILQIEPNNERFLVHTMDIYLDYLIVGKVWA